MERIIELTLSSDIPEAKRLQMLYDLLNKAIRLTGVQWTCSTVHEGEDFRVFRVAEDQEECDRLCNFGRRCRDEGLVSQVNLGYSRMGQQSTYSSGGWFDSESILKNWPPRDLDKNQSHILVTIGEPFTPGLQRVKLATFLNKAPSGNNWSVLLPPVNYAGGFCGLVFSTGDRQLFQSELNAVKGMKCGPFHENGKAGKPTAGDRIAYTSLNVLDCAGEIERASDEFDDVVLEYDASRGLSAESDTIDPSTEGMKVVTVATTNVGGQEVEYPVIIPRGFRVCNWGGNKSDVMKKVYERHLQWILTHDRICRKKFVKLSKMYNHDKDLPLLMKKNVKSALMSAFFYGECHVYGVDPSVIDNQFSKKASNENKRFQAIHDHHKQWMEDQKSLSWEMYINWLQIYRNDPFVGDDLYVQMERLALDKYLVNIYG